ncbi:glutaredoxin-1-like [Haliotis rufescens]|uniref:glutaredoxin-1-like n=1 Tax=Haliotis rufescens TaxID=6454 RepID=UPI001EB03ED9|nr:glutaredoxin-1-like [Haliotis rufescens]
MITFRNWLRVNTVSTIHCFVRFTGYTTSTMSDVKLLVDNKIEEKKVMVFSKSTCPYCTKAKAVLKKYIGDGEILSAEEYEVMEIERDSRCSAIQDYLLKITGGRSVPRVFINGKFLGGGDETVAADKSGELKSLLKA